MKSLTFCCFIILLNIKIYLTNNFIATKHSEYLTIKNDKGISEKYTLELIFPKKSPNLNTESNKIEQNNNLFFFISNNDTKWKDVIIYSRKSFIVYVEDFNTFSSIFSDMKDYRIKQIIIGYNSTIDKNEISLYSEKTDKAIFINNQKEEIKKKYLSYSNEIICSTEINILYDGDVIADKFVMFIFIFIILFIGAWIIIHRKARKNSKYLFIHSYILVILIIYFFHSLFYLILVLKNKYKIFDEENFSGALYNFFNFFQFFTKLLPSLCATMQLNLLELREHYRIIRNSKVIHVLCVNIFFIISLENDNESLSEILNGTLYILVVLSLFYMFIQFKNCIEERMIDGIIDEPEIIPALKYKKKLLYSHTFTVILFVIIYFIILSILRNFFEEYRTIKFIIVLVNYSDLFLTIFLCVIHFPKELPPLFMEQIIMEEPDFNINDVENEDFKNIYAYEQIDEEQYFEKYNPKEMANIVIIENPFNENKISLEIEEEEQEKEEGEEKLEKVIDKNEEKNKVDSGIETTEENSIENSKEDNEISISNINIEKEKNHEDNSQNENESNLDKNQNGEEEHHALVVEEKEIEKINKSYVEEDILDLSHTKLGYIEIEPL